jgi:hypothetical protein
MVIGITVISEECIAIWRPLGVRPQIEQFQDMSHLGTIWPLLEDRVFFLVWRELDKGKTGSSLPLVFEVTSDSLQMNQIRRPDEVTSSAPQTLHIVLCNWIASFCVVFRDLKSQAGIPLPFKGGDESVS